MTFNRSTLKSEISFQGIGLHKGNAINLKLIPANINHGITIKRTDLKTDNVIKVDVGNVFEPIRSTNLKNDKGVKIYTVEHLFSVLYVYNITDLIIEVDSNEMPVGDGSSIQFVELIQKAGIKKFDEEISPLKITEPIYITEESKQIIALPCDQLKISYLINYDHSFLKTQFFEFVLTKEEYKKKIAKSRTYGFDFEVDYLRKNNLALGGTLDNAIVITENGILNPGGLRYRDEFVRHKILDLIGDLKILNKPILGHIIAIKSGHDLDMKLINKLLTY